LEIHEGLSSDRKIYEDSTASLSIAARNSSGISTLIRASMLLDYQEVNNMT